MKRIIICCDGTWNTPDQIDREVNRPSNVVKTARAVCPSDDNDIVQCVYYDFGVGTGPGLDKWIGGAFGKGLETNICDAYRFIINNYEPEDDLYLFGFSRGAYTVRSLAGLIHNAGILRKTDSKLVSEAFELYKDRSEKPDSSYSICFRELNSFPDRTIKFVGVWDTVGSLGLPINKARIRTRRRHQFHDMKLSDSIKNACHAVAIDEKRGPFTPTLWEKWDNKIQKVEQIWFTGVHVNIGGGYEDSGLSDITLHWMLKKVSDCGLAIDQEYLDNIIDGCNYAGELRNSRKGYFLLLGKYVRDIGQKEEADEVVHNSAIARHRDVSCDYSPDNLIDYLQLINIC